MVLVNGVIDLFVIQLGGIDNFLIVFVFFNVVDIVGLIVLGSNFSGFLSVGVRFCMVRLFIIWFMLLFLIKVNMYFIGIDEICVVVSGQVFFVNSVYSFEGRFLVVGVVNDFIVLDIELISL